MHTINSTDKKSSLAPVKANKEKFAVCQRVEELSADIFAARTQPCPQ